MKLFLSLIVVATFVASGQAGRITDALQAVFLRGTRQDVVIDFPNVMGHALPIGHLGSNPSEAAQTNFINTLRAQTRAVQLPVLNAIQSLGLSEKATPFWIANRIELKGVEIGPLRALAAIPGNFVIREGIRVKAFPVVETPADDQESYNRRSRQSSDTPYGVTKVGAPNVWAKGNKGEGIVIGVIDTGANTQHEALSGSYKGDELSWYDAFGEHETPYDGNGHGTHCAGTIAGTTRGIGVAPGAKFMACRGLDDEGSGNDTTLLTCGQFMACPSNPMNTTDANCTGAPRAVSNSWGGLIGGMDFYNPVINAWRQLGIIPVFALGNSGPLCQTAGSPGDQDNLISVGATDTNDKLAMFSSRGPALVSRATKPEVSAPGKDILSASNKDNQGYVKLSGTSMACPHVAGTVALILSGNPKLDYAGVKSALETTAAQPKLGFMDSAGVCTFGFPPGYPNNGYGYGRINAEAAVQKGQATGK